MKIRITYRHMDAPECHRVSQGVGEQCSLGGTPSPGSQGTGPEGRELAKYNLLPGKGSKYFEQ